MDLTNVLIDALLVLYVIVCLLMGLAIMMQRSKQEGLGTAFGGSVTSEIFGAGASAFLVKATVWLALMFFTLSISLAWLYSHRASTAPKGNPLFQELAKPVAPATDATPPAPAASASKTTPATPPPAAPPKHNP